MIKEYMFNDAENMIDLAREIQSYVYWGGHFSLDSQEVPWKEFWDIVSVAKSVKKAIGVVIDSSNLVTFLYKEEIS